MFECVNELVLNAKALADPTRVRILMALREQELCVCELCDVLDVTQSTLSTHLQIVRGAGLVSTRKAGKWMYYAMTPEAANKIGSLMRLFSPSLSADATLRNDAKRLKRRLSLRNGGACCVGFPNKKSCC